MLLEPAAVALGGLVPPQRPFTFRADFRFLTLPDYFPLVVDIRDSTIGQTKLSPVRNLL